MQDLRSPNKDQTDIPSSGSVKSVLPVDLQGSPHELFLKTTYLISLSFPIKMLSLSCHWDTIWVST